MQSRTLTGTDFDLFIGETPLNITGKTRYAKTINAGLPGPLLRWKEGDTVTLRVKKPLCQSRPLFTGMALSCRQIWMTTIKLMTIRK